MKKINLPLGGVLGSAQSLQAAAFRPEHGLLSEAARGYLQRQEWEIRDESTQNRSDDTKIRQMTS